MFSTGTHPCGPRIHEQTKCSAASAATYTVTQEMQSIATWQTSRAKGETELPFKDFFTEAKFEMLYFS